MLAEQLREYVQSVSKGLLTNRDDAWHSLVSAGPAALPYVEEVFYETKDLDKRVALITVISEYRTEHALDFLSSQLSLEESAIWKAALDGLVSLSGKSVLHVLTRAVSSAQGKKHDWILEAIEDVRGASVDGDG